MTKPLNYLKDHLTIYYDLAQLSSYPLEYEKQKRRSGEIFKTFQAELDVRIAEQETEEKLRLLIRNCVTKLGVFADDFHRFYHENLSWIDEFLGDFVGFFSEIERKMFEIYEYLRYYFSDCFNNTIAIPEAFYGMIKCKVDTILISESLSRKHVDEQLTRIINEYLNFSAGSRKYKIQTWIQLSYFDRLSNALMTFALQDSTEDDTLALIKILVRKNFNADEFYNFIITYIDNSSRLYKTYEEERLELQKLSLTIEQVRPIINLSFNDEFPSIQESINKVISQSMTKNLDTITELVNNATSRKSGEKSDFYFECKRPIVQVMFFLRVVERMGIIETRSRTALYAFIINHVEFDRSKSPSPRYMKNLNQSDENLLPLLVLSGRIAAAEYLSFVDKHWKDQLNR